MRGTVGLLLYVAVMVLGSILKKMAENKAKQAPMPTFDDDEVYTVTLDDMLATDSTVEERLEASETVTGLGLTLDERVDKSHSQDTRDAQDWDDVEDIEWAESADDSESSSDDVKVPLGSAWAQAIVLSEIIREPRAKRAWPSR
ncbi:MAG: hypothetical protein M0R49_08100 [Limnochordia bacterium]|jgi:hypothetical protein|nr:hypothetical protein [Limnochordia bacterium]